VNRSSVDRLPRLALGWLILASACSHDSEIPLEPASDPAALRTLARVTSAADAGPGSFRQALLDANASSSITSIRFESGLGTINLVEPVTYSGTQALVIRGGGARLVGSDLAGGESAFVAEGGGDLTIHDLTVVKAPGNGITIKVPGLASGVFTVRLHQVTIRENGLHGILINDQAEYFSDPLSESEAGSAASLLVEVSASRFEKNGFALIDSDGLRINEGGVGTLEAHIRDTRFLDNGADGLELDERAAGHADFTLTRTLLIGNGSFSAEDFDDGIDVDEGSGGDLVGRFKDVVARGNFEQGVDLNENGAGNLRVRMADVRAVENNEEGIEFEEDDDVEGGGNIHAELLRVTARANGRAGGDAGLKLREKGAGNLVANLVQALAVDNRLGSGDPIAGILIREDETGHLTAEVVQATARHNSGDGIQFEENEAGNLAGRIRRSTATGNDGAGANLTQAAPGNGEVVFANFTAAGNAGGPVLADGVTTPGAP
jgi:hypothetical protein